MGKIMMGLVLAAMIGSIDVVPALGKDNHKSKGKHDNRRYEHRQGDNHYRYYDQKRGWYYNDEHGRRHYRHYGYRERIYAPPPVIYAPPPPPGISIFFPPIVIPIR
jgi:hypothetical protein